MPAEFHLSFYELNRNIVFAKFEPFFFIILRINLNCIDVNANFTWFRVMVGICKRRGFLSKSKQA